MPENSKGAIGSPPKSKTVHVGLARFTSLSEVAIDVSYESKRPVTPSQVLKFLIDKYLDLAGPQLVAELKREQGNGS